MVCLFFFSCGHESGMQQEDIDAEVLWKGNDDVEAALDEI